MMTAISYLNGGAGAAFAGGETSFLDLETRTARASVVPGEAAINPRAFHTVRAYYSSKM